VEKNKIRKESTIVRHNIVHKEYEELLISLGEYKNYVSKEYIYNKIKEKTGYTVRTISKILNHTERTD